MFYSREKFMYQLTDIRIFALLCFITKSYLKSIDVRRKITRGAKRKSINKISWHQILVLLLLVSNKSLISPINMHAGFKCVIIWNTGMQTSKSYFSHLL